MGGPTPWRARTQGGRGSGFGTATWSLRNEWLPALWAVYFFLVNTLAYEPELTRPIIWFGGAVVGLLTVMKVKLAVLRVGREVWLLLGFFAWAALGVLLFVGIPSSDLTFRYFRLVIQFAAIIILLRTVMRITGGMNWLWASFVLVGIYHVVMQPAGLNESPLSELGSPARMAAVGAGENTLGWYGFMGALGAMVLLGETRRLWAKSVISLGGMFGVFAVVASASRGGFIAFAMATVLWPLMCLRVRLRQTASFVVAVLVIGAGAYLFVNRIYSGSYLSARMGNVESELEGEGSRLNLLRAALDLAIRNPIVGVGFGEFPLASGTLAYAHSDGAELAASTGLVGFGLYYSMYWVLWSRLTRNCKRVASRILVYRANCARMVLLILLVSGLLFKPHFTVISSMFLFALVTGATDWLDRVSPAHPVISGEARTQGLKVSRATSANVFDSLTSRTHRSGSEAMTLSGRRSH